MIDTEIVKSISTVVVVVVVGGAGGGGEKITRVEKSINMRLNLKWE